jgi:four helix bundle protein
MTDENTIDTTTRNHDLPIFVKWMDFIKWLFVVTEKFPKSVRFTFIDRIHNLALSVVEELVEARYSKHKQAILGRINVKVETLRVLLRITYELRYLPTKSYQQAMLTLSEIGRMLGGWMKQQRHGAREP